MIKYLLLGTAVFGLAACGMVTVYEPNYSQGYYDGALEYAASKGEIHTEIEGDRLGMPKDRFDDVVTRSMHGANFGPKVAYTTGHSDKTIKAYKVVMVFNGPRNLAPSDLCAEDRKPVPTQNAKGRVVIYSVFCQYERVLSEVGGSVSGVSGPDDPKFRSLVRQVTASLFPAYDHLDMGNEPKLKP